MPRRPDVPRSLVDSLTLPKDPQGRTVYPGQREAHDRLLDVLLGAAGRFWDQRQVTGGPVSLLVASQLGGIDDDPHGPEALGRGWKGAGGVPGQIVLNDRWTGQRLAQLRSGRPRAQARAVRGLYAELVHEMGHARDLPHTEEGIMDPAVDVVPGDWKAVARELGVTRFPKPRFRQRTIRPGLIEG